MTDHINALLALKSMPNKIEDYQLKRINMIDIFWYEEAHIAYLNRLDVNAFNFYD